MRRRTWVLPAVLALLALPVALVVADAISFSVSQRSNGFLVSSGFTREYLLYVPRTYDRTKPAPLVISMHGAAGWGAAQRDTDGWGRIADREGLIVVYPSGMQGGGPRIWHVEPGPRLGTDVTFIVELIDTLSGAYNIDPARIYADGLSNGGGMAFVLSCTLSNRIAAVGMVAAAQTLPWNWCTDRTPVPMIAFHGTADPIVPYAGTGTPVSSRSFPSVPAWTASWAQRNRCAAIPADTVAAAHITRRTYSNCADEADVVLYTIRGGGHTWPGGGPMPEWLTGPTSREIDATNEMWAFFRAHPRPRK